MRAARRPAGRRLRAQPAEPARRRRARGTLPGVRRPEPHLRNARGHPEALLAPSCRAHRRCRARRRGATFPRRHPAQPRSAALQPGRRDRVQRARHRRRCAVRAAGARAARCGSADRGARRCGTARASGAGRPAVAVRFGAPHVVCTGLRRDRCHRLGPARARAGQRRRGERHAAARRVRAGDR